ncbi:MAG TPA: anti-sigma factor [Cellulomonas sp.]
MSAENPHALTGAYALDALAPDERAAFEQHLATCPDCREEVAGLVEAVGRLGAASAATPPPGLRAQVLDEVGRTAQTAPAAPLPPLPAFRPALAAPDRAGRRRAAAWRRWPAAVAAAAVIAVGGAVGGTLAVQQHRADQATADAQTHMMLIATAPDAVSHDVALGTSHVVMSRTMSAAALVGEDVPMPSNEGTTYQLWMVHADGSTAPGPTFVPDGGQVLAFVEGDLSSVTALTITEEPSGGSAAPSGDVVADVPL